MAGAAAHVQDAPGRHARQPDALQDGKCQRCGILRSSSGCRTRRNRRKAPLLRFFQHGILYGRCGRLSVCGARRAWFRAGAGGVRRRTRAKKAGRSRAAKEREDAGRLPGRTSIPPRGRWWWRSIATGRPSAWIISIRSCKTGFYDGARFFRVMRNFDRAVRHHRRSRRPTGFGPPPISRRPGQARTTSKAR